MVLCHSPAVVLVIHAHPRHVSAFRRVVMQELHERRVACCVSMAMAWHKQDKHLHPADLVFLPGIHQRSSRAHKGVGREGESEVCFDAAPLEWPEDMCLLPKIGKRNDGGDGSLMCIWVSVLHPKMVVLVDSVRVEGSASFGYEGNYGVR